MSGIQNPLTGEEIGDEDILSLSELCSKQRELESIISSTEERLKKLKEQLEGISTKEIPMKMDALGMTSIKLRDGTKVEVKPFYSVKLLDGAYTWLDENQHGGLIKTDVVRGYTREERDAALQFVRDNPDFNLKESIHWATLNAFAKEIYSNNETLPAEHFSVYQGSRTKLSS